MGGVYLNPLDFPDDWNRVQIAGLTTPGKCKMGKWERKADYDHKKGKGTKGADQTLKELPPAEGEAEFWAWTPAHFAAWTPILDALRFDPTKLGSSTPAAPGASGTAATSPAGSITTPSGQTIAVTAANSSQILAAKQSGDFSAVEASASGNSSFTGNTPSASASTSNSTPALSSAYAIDFFHPASADLDVAYVLPPESIGSWEEDGEGSGMYKRSIKFVEFTGAPPNKSIAATPSGSQDANAVQPGTTPAGGADPLAASGGAGSATGAGKDAQGAWGAA